MDGIFGSFGAWLNANVHLLTLWIGALCTLGLYSVLYKENRIYRLFEHMFLGLATGYMAATIWTDVLLPKWWMPMIVEGKWWLILALSAGLLYYFIYSKKHQWMSRLIVGFFLGVTAGQAFQVFVNDTWPQIPASFKPILPHPAIAANAPGNIDHKAIAALSPAMAINNLIFMVVLVSVLSYFFFSFEQKHPLIRGSAKLGRWLMMFTFGAIFGLTMMARMALLIDRMDFLVNEFSPAAFGGPVIGKWVMLFILCALVAVVLFLVNRDNRNAERDQTNNA
jgi:hypothetical protein